MNGKVVAVVVTYNRKALLCECIEALLKQTYENMDVLIVDNGSTDGTYDQIRTFIQKRVRYVNTGKNLGGAGGFYYGIKRAIHQGCDYLWIMDDDTVPEATALEELMKAGDCVGGTFGALSSCVLWNDGNYCRMNHPGFKRDMLDGKDYTLVKKGILNMRYASFVSLLIPSRVVLEVGLPIKEFFIWKDDYEYTTRISSLYNCYYVASSRVVHKMENNSLPNIATEEKARLWRYVYSYRNGYYLARRQGIEGKLRYYYEAFLDLYKILKNSRNCKTKRIRIMVKGILKGWFFHPTIKYCSK